MQSFTVIIAFVLFYLVNIHHSFHFNFFHSFHFNFFCSKVFFKYLLFFVLCSFFLYFIPLNLQYSLISMVLFPYFLFLYKVYPKYIFFSQLTIFIGKACHLTWCLQQGTTTFTNIPFDII